MASAVMEERSEAADRSAAGASKREAIAIESDEEDGKQDRTKRRRVGVSEDSKPPNMNAELGAAHLARRALQTPQSDEELARILQEEEARQANMARTRDAEQEDEARKGQSACPSAAQGGHDSRHHPTFRADGLGFWLLHTEGIKKEANSKEHCVRLRDAVVGDIQWAVLSNYLYDMDWLREEVPKLDDIPCVSVLFHRREAGDGAQFSHLPHNYRPFAPPLPGMYGTHHSKFVLLGYKTGVRVIVLTCNNIEQDHYHMSDALWAQDFPRKTDAGKGNSSDFEDTLVRYLEKAEFKGAQAGGQRVDIGALRAFDFSGARASLIVSAPGSHEDVGNWGHTALRKALEAEACPKEPYIMSKNRPKLCQKEPYMSKRALYVKKSPICQKEPYITPKRDSLTIWLRSGIRGALRDRAAGSAIKSDLI